MTSKTLTEWVKNLEKMLKKKRKIAPIGLTAVELIYLDPNTTSKTAQESRDNIYS